MKHFIIKNGCKVVCISAIALSSLSSCMKDDLTNCPAPKVSLKFDYTYNVENADAFSQEVKNLTSMFSIKTVNTSIPIRICRQIRNGSQHGHHRLTGRQIHLRLPGT